MFYVGIFFTTVTQASAFADNIKPTERRAGNIAVRNVLGEDIKQELTKQQKAILHKLI